MSTSSFKIIALLFFATGCTSWYHKLPAPSPPLFHPDGLWQKPEKERNTYMSRLFKNKYNEHIRFNPADRTFVRVCHETTEKNGITTQSWISGSGTYTQSGNWLLLKTTEISKGPNLNNLKMAGYWNKRFRHNGKTLLYHYHENTLAPMHHDTCYSKRDFGIREYVREPYREDEYFYMVRKKFAQKEYHPHVYFRSP